MVRRVLIGFPMYRNYMADAKDGHERKDFTATDSSGVKEDKTYTLPYSTAVSRVVGQKKSVGSPVTDP